MIHKTTLPIDISAMTLRERQSLATTLVLNIGGPDLADLLATVVRSMQDEHGERELVDILDRELKPSVWDRWMDKTMRSV